MQDEKLMKPCFVRLEKIDLKLITTSIHQPVGNEDASSMIVDNDKLSAESERLAKRKGRCNMPSKYYYYEPKLPKQENPSEEPKDTDGIRTSRKHSFPYWLYFESERGLSRPFKGHRRKLCGARQKRIRLSNVSLLHKKVDHKFHHVLYEHKYCTNDPNYLRCKRKVQNSEGSSAPQLEGNPVKKNDDPNETGIRVGGSGGNNHYGYFNAAHQSLVPSEEIETETVFWLTLMNRQEEKLNNLELPPHPLVLNRIKPTPPAATISKPINKIGKNERRRCPIILRRSQKGLKNVESINKSISGECGSRNTYPIKFSFSNSQQQQCVNNCTEADGTISEIGAYPLNFLDVEIKEEPMDTTGDDCAYEYESVNLEPQQAVFIKHESCSWEEARDSHKHLLHGHEEEVATSDVCYSDSPENIGPSIIQEKCASDEYSGYSVWNDTMYIDQNGVQYIQLLNDSPPPLSFLSDGGGQSAFVMECNNADDATATMVPTAECSGSVGQNDYPSLFIPHSNTIIVDSNTSVAAAAAMLSPEYMSTGVMCKVSPVFASDENMIITPVVLDTTPLPRQHQHLQNHSHGRTVSMNRQWQEHFIHDLEEASCSINEKEENSAHQIIVNNKNSYSFVNNNNNDDSNNEHMGGSSLPPQENAISVQYDDKRSPPPWYCRPQSSSVFMRKSQEHQYLHRQQHKVSTPDSGGAAADNAIIVEESNSSSRDDGGNDVCIRHDTPPSTSVFTTTTTSNQDNNHLQKSSENNSITTIDLSDSSHDNDMPQKRHADEQLLFEEQKKPLMEDNNNIFSSISASNSQRGSNTKVSFSAGGGDGSNKASQILSASGDSGSFKMKITVPAADSGSAASTIFSASQGETPDHKKVFSVNKASQILSTSGDSGSFKMKITVPAADSGSVSTIFSASQGETQYHNKVFSVNKASQTLMSAGDSGTFCSKITVPATDSGSVSKIFSASQGETQDHKKVFSVNKASQILMSAGDSGTFCSKITGPATDSGSVGTIFSASQGETQDHKKVFSVNKASQILSASGDSGSFKMKIIVPATDSGSVSTIFSVSQGETPDHKKVFSVNKASQILMSAGESGTFCSKITIPATDSGSVSSIFNASQGDHSYEQKVPEDYDFSSTSVSSNQERSNDTTCIVHKALHLPAGGDSGSFETPKIVPSADSGSVRSTKIAASAEEDKPQQGLQGDKFASSGAINQESSNTKVCSAGKALLLPAGGDSGSFETKIVTAGSGSVIGAGRALLLPAAGGDSSNFVTKLVPCVSGSVSTFSASEEEDDESQQELQEGHKFASSGAINEESSNKKVCSAGKEALFLPAGGDSGNFTTKTVPCVRAGSVSTIAASEEENDEPQQELQEGHKFASSGVSNEESSNKTLFKVSAGKEALLLPAGGDSSSFTTKRVPSADSGSVSSIAESEEEDDESQQLQEDDEFSSTSVISNNEESSNKKTSFRGGKSLLLTARNSGSCLEMKIVPSVNSGSVKSKASKEEEDDEPQHQLQQGNDKFSSTSVSSNQRELRSNITKVCSAADDGNKAQPLILPPARDFRSSFERKITGNTMILPTGDSRSFETKIVERGGGSKKKSAAFGSSIGAGNKIITLPATIDSRNFETRQVVVERGPKTAAAFGDISDAGNTITLPAGGDSRSLFETRKVVERSPNKTFISAGKTTILPSGGGDAAGSFETVKIVPPNDSGSVRTIGASEEEGADHQLPQQDKFSSSVSSNEESSNKKIFSAGKIPMVLPGGGRGDSDSFEMKIVPCDRGSVNTKIASAPKDTQDQYKQEDIISNQCFSCSELSNKKAFSDGGGKAIILSAGDSGSFETKVVPATDGSGSLFSTITAPEEETEEVWVGSEDSDWSDFLSEHDDDDNEEPEVILSEKKKK